MELVALLLGELKANSSLRAYVTIGIYLPLSPFNFFYLLKFNLRKLNRIIIAAKVVQIFDFVKTRQAYLCIGRDNSFEGYSSIPTDRSENFRRDENLAASRRKFCCVAT